MITGENINLREIEESDLPKMVEWRNKDRIRKCFFSQELLTLDKQKVWFKEYLKKDDDRIFIIETKDNIPIGTVGLKDIDLKDGKAEFGRTMIGEDEYLGKGLAKSAAAALMTYAFGEMGLEMLYLEVLGGNKAAINLYEKCGFCEERAGRRSILIDGEHCAVMTMTVLKDEYRKSI